MNHPTTPNLNPPVEVTDPEWDRLVPDPSVLRRARVEDLGLSRESMARMIGCSVGSCENWERGSNVPMKSIRARVLRAYGIALDEATTEAEGSDR